MYFQVKQKSLKQISGRQKQIISNMLTKILNLWELKVQLDIQKRNL